MKFVGALQDIIKAMDHLGDYHSLVHFVMGVFFGFFFGVLRPTIAFWGATAAGFGKETLDYIKHTHESASFHFLTDGKYGLYDGMGDLLLWMIGGYVAYKVWHYSHRMMRAHHARVLKGELAGGAVSIVNPATIEKHLTSGKSNVSLTNCLHSSHSRSQRLM